MDSSISVYSSKSDAAGYAIDRTPEDSGVKPLSAITKLSNLISSPPDKLKHSLTPSSTGVTHSISSLVGLGPRSLPTEVLQMIFQFVFESSISPKVSVDVHGDKKTSWLDEDPLSPCLFPYALACVCLRWLRILRTTPIYWTRLVVTVDVIAESLHGAHAILAWAGNCLLKVVITWRRDASQIPDAERAAVGRAMELLRPHLSRVWSLSFRLGHSSSIPVLWRECRYAQHLKVLSLRSHFGPDDSRIARLLAWQYNRDDKNHEAMFKPPLLQDVTFSSHFLKNSVMADPCCKDWFRNLTSLTVCGDAVTPGGNTVPLTRLISVITMFPIENLTVEDSDIQSEGYVSYSVVLELRLVVLCLRRVTGGMALLDILSWSQERLQDITIVNCPVDHFRELDPDHDLLFSSSHLTLASMDPSAKLEDVTDRWNGQWLSMSGCPKLSRKFLEGLHREAAPVRLSNLHIVDCDHFSTRDLVALVQSRGTQAEAMSLMGVLEEDDPFTALAELSVQGRGPSVTAKQVTWLAEHVEAFSWDTVARDGMRYVWDGSAKRLMVLPAHGS